MVIEEFNAKALVDGEDPITHVMHLVNQRFLISFQSQSGNGAQDETCLSCCNTSRRRRDDLGQPRQQRREFIRIGNGNGKTVTWAAMPGDELGILDVIDSEV